MSVVVGRLGLEPRTYGDKDQVSGCFSSSADLGLHLHGGAPRLIMLGRRFSSFAIVFRGKTGEMIMLSGGA
ncbi:hypothetical protein [Amycolatopsis sp. Poz14]|uniref:hypothetical protein n=1 Tax=Amycolatopsis sp. Poz14 TaxID=1447705 RepID=UPI001EE9416E|nr:hypothetical protein [Amycolatopsis sp. Poz14]MCG3749128.1 hypothetical protein [Amycolatopsis sp. Poz14]